MTKAVQIKNQKGAEITVIGAGDAQKEAVLRKALAIGADTAVRIDFEPEDSISVAKEVARYAQENSFDLILCGRESIDYNGGMVPASVAQILGYTFVNGVLSLDFESDNQVVIDREIEGGREKISCSLPLVIAGQKGIVEEKDLIIPNMRGIMSARTKPLQVINPLSWEVKVKNISYQSVAPRTSVKMIDENNLDELVRLLKEEAKVI